MYDDDFDWSQKVEDDYYLKHKNKMGFNITKVKSALVTLFLSVIVSGGGYILGVGDLWKIDTHALTNVIVLSAFATIIASIKLVGTSEQTGKFLGTTQVR